MITQTCLECRALITGHTGLEAQENNEFHFGTCPLYREVIVPDWSEEDYYESERRIAAEKAPATKAEIAEAIRSIRSGIQR